MMEGKQRLYYALGQLAYVVAMADGEVQQEELNKMHEMIGEHLHAIDPNFSYSEIIFELLSRQEADIQSIYDSAFDDIKSASYYLSDDMKSDFPAIIEKVARAFKPYTSEESKWVERIRTDLEKI